VAWWCNGYDVGLATQRVVVRLPATPLSDNNLRQVGHTHVPLSVSPSSINCYWSKDYGWEGNIGRVLHWPFITDLSSLSTYCPQYLTRGRGAPRLNSSKKCGTVAPLYNVEEISYQRCGQSKVIYFVAYWLLYAATSPVWVQGYK